MASVSNPEEKQRPLMLKDFLWDDSLQRLSCCEISQESVSTIKFLLEIESKSHNKRTGKYSSDRAPIPTGLSRSRSRAVLNKAFEAIINVVKLLPFPPRSPSPSEPTKKRPKHRALTSIFGRVAGAKDTFAHQSLSRRFTTATRSLSRRNKNKEQCEIRVRVRDIMRWKSFGDVDITHEQQNGNSPQRSKISDETLDFCSSSSSSRSGSRTWSHCASNLQSSCGGSEYSDENSPEEGKSKFFLLQGSSPNFHCSVGEKRLAVKGEVLETLGLDSVETATCYREPEAESQSTECLLEKEQLSPVSVLDFSYEDEETTTFEQSLTNMERSTQQLLRKILCFESLAELDSLGIEERIASSELEFSADDPDQYDEDRHDVAMSYSICQEERACEERAGDLYKFLKAGFEGRGLMGTLGQVDKEACINEMEKGGKWRNFKEEHEEMVVEMETRVLGLLVNEILLDLLDNAS